MGKKAKPPKARVRSRLMRLPSKQLKSNVSVSSFESKREMLRRYSRNYSAVSAEQFNVFWTGEIN